MESAKNRLDNLNPDLFKLSLESSEGECHEIWKTLITCIGSEHLNSIQECFTSEIKYITGTKEVEIFAITKDAFVNTIDKILGKGKFSFQALCMFNEIDKVGDGKITWDQFIDFILANSCKTINNTELETERILHLDIKREPIVKIVLLETDKSFCYVVVSKYGQVRIYDAKWTLLWRYVAILDETRALELFSPRRSHTKWITDVVHMPDACLLVVASSARCLTFYDVSRLHHTPIWFVSGMPNTPQRITYHYNFNSSILVIADDAGFLTTFSFTQPKIGILPRKHADKVTCYYWQQILEFCEFLAIGIPVKIHSDCICGLWYLPENEMVVTCSRNFRDSLVISHLRGRQDSYTFQVKRGISCFFLEKTFRVLITGSDDCHVRLWNPVVTQQPIATLQGHRKAIADVCASSTSNTVISCSIDGVLKIWDLKEYTHLQTIRLAFPPFDILGKIVEWGTKVIYPGPPTALMEIPKTGLEEETAEEMLSEREVHQSVPSISIGRQSSVESVVEICEESDATHLELQGQEWSRNKIVVACCDYVALLSVKPSCNVDSQTPPLVSPPPLYKDVLMPKSWRAIIATSRRRQAETPAAVSEPTLDPDAFQDLLERHGLVNIVNRSYLTPSTRHVLHQRLARLEEIKEMMKPLVAECVPYTALPIYELEELRFSCPMPVPGKKSHKHVADKAQRLMSAASSSTPVFTDRSRSTRSSFTSNK